MRKHNILLYNYFFFLLFYLYKDKNVIQKNNYVNKRIMQIDLKSFNFTNDECFIMKS